MTIDISDNDPRISYTANANGAQTAFAVPFEFFDNADLNVYIAGVLKSEGTGSANYGVSGGAGSTGTVTFVSGVTASAIVVITRSISIERTTDFTAGADINRAALNTQLDTLTAIAADLKDTAARALQLTDSDAAASLVLPAVADRKGKVLAFHATTGAVEAGPSTSAVQSVADNAAAVNLLGTAAVVEDMGLLATAAAIEDMSILGTSATVADMAILATDAIVADMAILATSDIVADMAILATTDVVADMNALATSDIISDLNTLATSDIVTDMNLLATSANVAAMGKLGLDAVIADMALLGTDAVVADLEILGTTDVVADMNTLATSDIVSDMNTLATSANVTAMGLLGTSAVVTDMGLLGTAAVVEDMGILGTSANVTAMSNVSGSISNVNTVASNISGVNDFAARYRIGSSDPSSNNDDGDLFYNTTSDSLKVYNAGASAWQAGVSLGSTPTFTSQTTGQINNTDAFPDIRPSLLLDFANSKTLDPRITFTRGSTATYYDGVTTAKAEENLLTYSQELDNSSWSKAAASITANQLAAPDGTTTAELFTADGSSAQHSSSKYPLTFTADNYVFSIFAKKGTNDFFQIRFNTDAGSGRANFDLNNGTTGGVSGVTATITDVGNGWYRCTAMEAASATTSGGVTLYLVGALTDAGAPTNALSTTVYYWGAQLEQRSAPTAYTPTTSAPVVKYQPTLQTAASGAARFDHDPVTGESKGLLIEEARTNSLTRSEEFTHAEWSLFQSTTTTDTVVAPDGTLTGTKLTPNTTSEEHYTDDALTQATGTFTDSVYAKDGGYKHLVLRPIHIGADEGGSQTVRFDLSTGTVQSSPSNVTATMEDVGNGWYRCSMSYTVTGTLSGSYAFRIQIHDDSYNSVFSGNGYSGIYIWGAQREAGTFPTSYIATAGSTATRALDFVSITGTNFTDWFSPQEGTIYADYEKQAIYPVDSRFLLLTDTLNSFSSNAIMLRGNDSPANDQLQIISNGSSVVTLAENNSDLNIQAVGAYSFNDFAFNANEYTVNTSSSGVLPSGINQMNLRADTCGFWFSKISYYPKRLPNATLQAMTSE